MIHRPIETETSELSQPLRLLSLVWAGCGTVTSHSWGRLNTCMWKALCLAIGAGMRFAPKDFAKFSRFRPGYWLNYESAYGVAVRASNDSAARSLEQWFGRPPYIADWMDPGGCGQAEYQHLISSRRDCRLFVGAFFQWNNERAKVTSFPDGAVFACSYRRVDRYTQEIVHRYRIPYADFRREMTARRTARKQCKERSDEQG